MVYVHPLSLEEKENLKKMTRQEIGRVAQRARAILLSNHGYTVQQIAFILERSDKTIRRLRRILPIQRRKQKWSISARQ